MKRFWILGLVAFFLFVILIGVENSQSNEVIDWRPNFSSNSKDPFGSFILYERLEDLFPEKEVEASRYTAYELCWESQQRAFNYLLINQDFDLSPPDVRGLLEFAAIGGQVFVAAERFRGLLADTLGLKTNYVHRRKLKPDTLVNVTLRETKRRFEVDQKLLSFYFTIDESEKIEVLAETEEGYPILLKISFYDGAFYISSNPLLFTNYNLLSYGGRAFVEQSLTHLPVDDVFWDEYYKMGRGEEENPLRFILGRKSLRSAYYALLLGIFLFILFEARRKQRPIPVVQAPANAQLEFAKVLGRLYYNEGQHAQLAKKQVNHLREELRNRFYTSHFPETEEDYESLSAKTNMDKPALKALFSRIKRLEQEENLSESELLRLHEDLAPLLSRKVKDLS